MAGSVSDPYLKELERLGAHGREGAKRLSLGAVSRSIAVSEKDLRFKMPVALQELFKTTGGVHQFFGGYATYSASGVPDVMWSMLYGLGSGDDSDSAYQTKMFQGRIPPNYWIFGEGPGGDMLCVDEAGKRVALWDHELSNTEENKLIDLAESLLDFIRGTEIS